MGVVRYFRVQVAGTVSGQWLPKSPTTLDDDEIDPRVFMSCRRYGAAVKLGTSQAGPIFPLNFGPFAVPIARLETAQRMGAVSAGDLELVEVVTESGEQLVILNVLTCRECIDETRPVGEKWAEEDGRPDRMGMYRTILDLFVDPDRCDGAHLLRITGWKTPTIVSEVVAALLTGPDGEGITLMPVS